MLFLTNLMMVMSLSKLSLRTHCSNNIKTCVDDFSLWDKAVLEPRVSPAFAITYFCNHCNIRFENTSKYVDTLTLFSKNLNQRSLTPRWPLTHVSWGHMCDSTQGSLCPSPMGIHQCMWTQWSILQITTYIHTHTTYILRTEWVIT